ncbi:hypothetical protein QFZ80_004954 [Paenibacillus sp. V4I7]|nr:hypothetical protein [Paenibacillus sp. V4I7]MDQ0920378.1 hypothetical protein [Paenibacillus sp. V4I5]
MALLPEHLWLFVRKHLEGSAFERRWGRYIISKIDMQEYGSTVSHRSGFGWLHLIVGRRFA